MKDEGKGNYNVGRVKSENAILRKYAMIQKASEEKIGCQKIYVDIAGGIPEAFVLDELVFYTLPRENGKSGLRIWKGGFLWMAVSRNEWWERKRLTPKEADGAIERLIDAGLVHKELFLFNKQKTTHLRLNVSEFFKRYTAILNEQNPSENDEDTILKDISDLYEMMGIPKRDTPMEGIPDRDTGVPNEDTVSPKGDSYNSPNTPHTHPFLNDEQKNKIIQASDKSMEAILGAERLFVQALSDGKAWKYRDNFEHNEIVLLFADLCTAKFGPPSKRDVSLWVLEIGIWSDRGFLPSDWKRACEITEKYDIPPAKPTSMTSALNTAAQERKNKNGKTQPQRVIHRAQPVEGITLAEAKARGLVPG